MCRDFSENYPFFHISLVNPVTHLYLSHQAANKYKAQPQTILLIQAGTVHSTALLKERKKDILQASARKQHLRIYLQLFFCVG